MDGGLMGAGAQPTGDGLDGSGMTTQVSNMVPDVEMNELMYPVLYLWKRLDDETGGPGRNAAGSASTTPGRCGTATRSCTRSSARAPRCPPAATAAAIPAAGRAEHPARDRRARRARAGSAADRPAETEVLELTAQGLVIRAGDVFRQRIAGGGGYGDPLLRAPEAVAADLRDGYITALGGAAGLRRAGRRGRHGRRAATRELRRSLRAARLGPDVRRPRDAPEPGLSVAGGPEGWSCRLCDTALGAGQDWTEGTVRREHTAAEHLEGLGIRVRPNAAVHVHEHLCPGCGSALDVRVVVQP